MILSEVAFAHLDELRSMAKMRPGTSGFSRSQLAAIKMAVEIIELIVLADREHNGDLEMHDVDVLDEHGNIDSGIEPKMLCVGGVNEFYGSTALDCFLKASREMRKQ